MLSECPNVKKMQNKKSRSEQSNPQSIPPNKNLRTDKIDKHDNTKQGFGIMKNEICSFKE